MKISILIIYVFLAFTSLSQDTLTINQFNSLVSQHHKKMKNILELKDSLTTDDAIILIKIENTLHNGIEKTIGLKDFKASKKEYTSFDSCFVLYYTKKVIKKVEAEATTGFGYYSKKYNILLGGQMNYPQIYYYIKK